MFLRLEISCVFAASPRYLLLGPKPTRDGVDLFETSFVIYVAVSGLSQEQMEALRAVLTMSIPLFLATPIFVDWAPKSIPTTLMAAAVSKSVRLERFRVE